MIEIAVFIFVFSIGEGLANWCWFAYLKRYFGFIENASGLLPTSSNHFKQRKFCF